MWYRCKTCSSCFSNDAPLIRIMHLWSDQSIWQEGGVSGKMGQISLPLKKKNLSNPLLFTLLSVNNWVIGQDVPVRLKPSMRMGIKGGLNDFEHATVVGARQAVWVFEKKNKKKLTDLLRLSHKSHLKGLIPRELSESEQVHPVSKRFSGRKCLVDATGRRRKRWRQPLVTAELCGTTSLNGTTLPALAPTAYSCRRITLGATSVSQTWGHSLPHTHKNWTIECWVKKKYRLIWWVEISAARFERYGQNTV